MKRGAPWAATATAGLLSLVGCALAGNPQPPTLWMPEPVRDLAAVRVGNEVHLHWTMPKNTTDKVALQGDQRAHICWTSGAAPAPQGKAPPRPVPSAGLPGCRQAADAQFPPNRPTDFTVPLPADVLADSGQVVSFFVELQNPSGKTAGPSNPAWVATGSAPPPVQSFTAGTQPRGVVLHWQPAAAEPGLVLRIHRSLIPGSASPGSAKPNEAAGTPPAQEQTLEVDLDKSDPGQALDSDAALDHVWRYTADRVRRVTADQHIVDLAGMPSQPVTIDAKNVFPPAVPSGLAAIANEQARAIDLSWTPNSDRNLAGYIVYRRDDTASTPMERISGNEPVVPATFEDRNVVAGHRYAYAVSAVSQNGIESARSAEVQEEVQENPTQ
ncbi:MAG TPA: fibronectin type III domain-containing protein [Acidobacteriaceae bacterium]|nr:fibronectin type III domain-containing protein [Acidobacteriaceae bacterium]